MFIWLTSPPLPLTTIFISDASKSAPTHSSLSLTRTRNTSRIHFHSSSLREIKMQRRAFFLDVESFVLVENFASCKREIGVCWRMWIVSVDREMGDLGWARGKGERVDWLIFWLWWGVFFDFFRNTTFLSIQFWNFTCHSFLYSILLSLSISISYFFYYNNTWISSENSNERKSRLHLTYSYIYYLVILIITQLPPPQLHNLNPHSQTPKPSSNSSMQIYLFEEIGIICCVSSHV